MCKMQIIMALFGGFARPVPESRRAQSLKIPDHRPRNPEPETQSKPKQPQALYMLCGACLGPGGVPRPAKTLPNRLV